MYTVILDCGIMCWLIQISHGGLHGHSGLGNRTGLSSGGSGAYSSSLNGAATSVSGPSPGSGAVNNRAAVPGLGVSPSMIGGAGPRITSSASSMISGAVGGGLGRTMNSGAGLSIPSFSGSRLGSNVSGLGMQGPGRPSSNVLQQGTNWMPIFSFLVFLLVLLSIMWTIFFIYVYQYGLCTFTECICCISFNFKFVVSCSVFLSHRSITLLNNLVYQ